MSQLEGKTLQRISYETGIRLTTLQLWCKNGRIIGARKHPLTKKWLVFPPAKLITGSGDARPWPLTNSAASGSYAA